MGGDGETLSEAAAPTRLLYTFSLLSEVKGTKVLRDFLTLGTGPCTVASVTSQQSTAEGGEGRLLDLSQTRGHLLGVRQYLFSFPSPLCILEVSLLTELSDFVSLCSSEMRHTSFPPLRPPLIRETGGEKEKRRGTA